MICFYFPQQFSDRKTQLISCVGHSSPTSISSCRALVIQGQDPVLSPREVLGLESFHLYSQPIDAAKQASTSMYLHHPLHSLVSTAPTASFCEKAVIFSWLTEVGTSASCRKSSLNIAKCKQAKGCPWLYLLELRHSIASKLFGLFHPPQILFQLNS